MGMHNDTMILEIGTALTQVHKKVQNKFRPLKYREFITPTTSIDPAVEVIRMEKRIDYAEIRPITSIDQVYPLPSEEKTATSVTVHEFGSGFRLMDDELRRAAKTGDAPGANRLAAIYRVTEELFDRVAAVGYPDLGMRGMLTQPDVTPLTTGWTGKWLATGTTPTQMLADLNLLLDSVREASGDVVEANAIVLPPEAYRVAERTQYTPNLADSVLQVFQRQNPGVTVHTWSHARSAAVNGRAMAWVQGDSDVFEMFVPQPLTADEPIRIKRGYEQALYCKLGGVFSLFPQGISYGDGILATA